MNDCVCCHRVNVSRVKEVINVMKDGFVHYIRLDGYFDDG